MMWRPLFSAATPFLLASTTTRRTLKTLKDLKHQLSAIYDSLERPGNFTKVISPTLRFSYVPPPLDDGTRQWDKPAWNESFSVNDADVPGPEEAANKPIAVYIPGLDGYGMSAATFQFDDLASTFELWRFFMAPADRSSLTTVVSAVANFCADLIRRHNKRHITLIGESCGGMLATLAALRLQNRNLTIDGLVLVNPATSFAETSWESLAPLLTSLQYLEDAVDNSSAPAPERLTPYAVVGSLVLSGLIPDRQQFGRLVDLISSTIDIPPSSFDQVAQLFNTSVGAVSAIAARLPPGLVEHRVAQWLGPGASILTKQRLSQLLVPTLIVVGDQDSFLPSKAEAERLETVMPVTRKLLVPDRGHFILDDSVNLTEAIVYCNQIDPLNRNATKRYDVIADWKSPSAAKIRQTIQKNVAPLRWRHSPVFFTTDQHGRRWKGLAQLPDDSNSPLLFVGNHQFAALDLPIIIGEFLEKTTLRPVRGLAHPVAFLGSEVNELLGRTAGLRNNTNNRFGFENFQAFGALPVTPRNYYRLLQTKQNTMLFPGGAKEALTGSTNYPLFWPDKQDFVRTAARFNATIVPFSAIGMVDGVKVLIEPEDVVRLPFVGERARNASRSVAAARYDQEDDDEILLPPIAAPKVPARNYVLFGTPISTNDVNPKDKAQCELVYRAAQAEARRGLDDLLAARSKDPFLNTPRRIAYERIWGKSAPTFAIDELN